MTKEERTADSFLLMAVAALLLSFVSFVVAFPLQVILVMIAATKARLNLIPAIFVLLLDSSNFHRGALMKFRLGIALSVQNIFLITIFFYSFAAAARRRLDSGTVNSFLPWLSTLVPALWMGLEARSEGLTVNWQQPFVLFLAPALYYWGVAMARTWDEDRDYFFSRMIVLMTVLNVLEFVGMFYIFTFSEHITIICLFIGSWFIGIRGPSRIVGMVGAAFGGLNVLLGRYFQMMNKTGFASSVDLGSTFTRVMVVAIGVALAFYFIKRGRGGTIKTIPYFALIACTIIFSYSVMRAKAHASDIEGSDIRSWAERFEYKLIGDRGALWAESIEEAFRKPLFFKRLGDQIVYVKNPQTGTIKQDIKLLPHNQVLTLLITAGWWQGLFCILFLWWTHTRAFKAASNMVQDRALLCGLLAPSAAVFIAVGLTGQAVFTGLLCGNGLVTMVYPGVIYGVWRNRRRLGVRGMV